MNDTLFFGLAAGLTFETDPNVIKAIVVCVSVYVILCLIFE